MPPFGQRPPCVSGFSPLQHYTLTKYSYGTIDGFRQYFEISLAKPDFWKLSQSLVHFAAYFRQHFPLKTLIHFGKICVGKCFALTQSGLFTVWILIEITGFCKQKYCKMCETESCHPHAQKSCWNKRAVCNWGPASEESTEGWHERKWAPKRETKEFLRWELRPIVNHLIKSRPTGWLK